MARYKVRPIDDHTFALEEKTFMTQGLCYLLLGQERALLIDTGFGDPKQKPLVQELAGRLPVVVANTHAHVDHIGGNHRFEELWFHEADRAVFALHTDPAYTLRLATESLPPQVRFLFGKLAKRLLTVDPGGRYQYFQDGHVFHLGGRDVEVVHTPGHTPGSVCFLDRASRQLFSGDTVCDWGVLLNLVGESCRPEVFRDSMLRLEGMQDSFDAVWPGHHDFPSDKGLIEEYRHCAERIVSGEAWLERDKGRLCARYGRILVMVPETEERG